jgi:hypothetical protein
MRWDHGIYDLGNVYVFMHMSMHEVNKPGSVPPNPRLIQAVGV